MKTSQQPAGKSLSRVNQRGGFTALEHAGAIIDKLVYRIARSTGQPSAIAALALVLAYGGGLWMHILHEFEGATERVALPSTIHYLRDATLAFPLLLLATWAGLWLTRRWYERTGRQASLLTVTITAATSVALLCSAVAGAASPLHDIMFGAQHSHHEFQPWWLHMANHGLLSLAANLPIAILGCVLLGARMWQAGPAFRLRHAIGRRAGQFALAMMIVVALLVPQVEAAPRNALAASSTLCPAGAPTKSFDVSAIDVNMWLNRFGDHDPTAQMYVLNSMISAVRNQEAAGPGSLSIGLRDDPIQPLAIRANGGDCVIINFTNATTRPAPQGGTPGATTNTYGLHVDGLAYQVGSSGDNIGNNGQSAVPGSGGSAQYIYYIPNDPTLEGAHYIHPGPGNRQAVAHGLFGTLNVEPPGSIYLNMTTGQPQLSGWEAIIVPGAGKAFREGVQVFHEIGNDSERGDLNGVPIDIEGKKLPSVDPHTDAYRPGSRAINYRSESFMDRLDYAEDQKAVVYSAYTFGDTSNVIQRGYLGDPTKIRLVHGGSEVFHVFHLHGGSVRWRFNPKADPTYDYSKTGLDKHPVEIQSESARLDSQSMGPGETFDLEIENGAGGGQQGAGEFLFHCHIAHHYFAGMWGYWRVYDTLQPDLMPLPDRAALVQAVDSAALVNQTFGGQLIAAENLDAWIRPQLPTQGITHDINVATKDTADQDASVWDWTVDPPSGLYLGEPDRNFVMPSSAPNPLVGEPWVNFATVVPGHPMALIVDQTVVSKYILNGGLVTFNAGGYVGSRPKLLFNPTNGRPAFPLLRPHIGKRPPFSPNGHSGAPYLGEYGGQAANPVLPVGTTSTAAIDPWANRPDGICPAGAPLRMFNIVGIGVPIQVTAPGKGNVIDPNGALDVLAQDKDAVYAGTKVYAGVTAREPLAIRGNIGDCIGVTYVSELTDGNPELPYSKTNIHIHHVQFDTQGSDGVITGFSFEQSIRPYKIVDPQLGAALNAGDITLRLSSVAKFQPGVWIAIGIGLESIEIRQIVTIDRANSTVTISQPVAAAHAAQEWAGTEFVQYRWYPDVELDNVFFHDHVNGIHGWSHGMVGQLVIEPAGSTYHDPVTGAEIRAGAIADIHTDPTCIPVDNHVSNQCALIPGVVDGSFREFVLWTINDHEAAPPPGVANPEATLNLRAEPWSVRGTDPARRFSSTTAAGDPYTPLPKAYVGDNFVIRNINVGQGTNTLSIDGHRTFWEPRYLDALGMGIESSPIDTIHTSVSEKFTLILSGGAGGPNHVPGDYIYHDGENRRFQDGAWGIIRVLPAVNPSVLLPLPNTSIPVQLSTCPAGAPPHTFAISAVDLPSTAAGGGQEGRKSAFVPTAQAAAVIAGQLFPEPLVLHVAHGECVNVTLNNQRKGDRASFHVGGLLRDLNSAGINVGLNPDTTVAVGQTRTYTFYADTFRLESTTISDFGGDNSGWDGLYGALVVAPAGATFSDPVTGVTIDAGAQVDVHVPNTSGYRDFTLLLADHDPVIGQSKMPYPANVSGPALINYRQVLNRIDDANMFSSATYGDPTTPLLRAYAGDPVKVHVLGAPASEQVHVFSLGGMSWPGDMYIYHSSQWQSRAVGPWEKIDLNVSGGAGGVAQVPGDYFYGDLKRHFTQAGMWGLFRVLPNTCASGGTAGLLCLGANTPPPALTITSVSPVSGPTSGGTAVTIAGTNFDTASGGTTISFGPNAATGTTCSSTTSCTATTPAGTAGPAVNVTVTAHGSSATLTNAFTYVAASVPTVTGLNPTAGPTAGGTVVTIAGTGFSPVADATTVNFIPGGSTASASNAATNVSCTSNTSCTATSPAGLPGKVDVHVTVGGQQSPNAPADAFTYNPPTVTGVSPNSGATVGGTVVAISGADFSTVAGATTVNFIPGGGTASASNLATNVSCSSTTQCTATSPAGSVGNVDVHVTVLGVQSPNTPADTFSYVAIAPTVTGLNPTSGPAGTVVTITGANYSRTPGATTVKFGAAAATNNVSCSSTTTCTATSPAGSGTVDVIVTVGGLSSAISNSDKFLYTTTPVMTTVNVPVPSLSKGFGYWFTFTSAGAGTINATWTTPTKVNGTLAIYAGNPFSGKTDPVKLSPPKKGALAASTSSTNGSFSVATVAQQPAGTYTVYFFAGSGEPASSGTVSYMKLP
jgi:hypothetical protein